MALTLTRLPVLGTFLSRLVGIPAIIARGESFGTESEEARRVVAHFTNQFKVKGTERMMRDMIIGDALSDRMADHEKIAAGGMRAQFVYALDDPEIMRADVEAALALYDAPDVHQYTGGHFFSTGRTEELSKIDGVFSPALKRHPAGRIGEFQIAETDPDLIADPDTHRRKNGIAALQIIEPDTAQSDQ